MEPTAPYQRTTHRPYDVDDDLSDSSGREDESDSEYGADHEDNDDIPDDRVVLRDPGHFKYNRKLFLTSLPCLLMILGLVGEVLLMTVSFGAGLIIMLDPKGEKKRCIVLFALVFVFCHMFTIYSVLPLLWLSFFNFILIAMINFFVILTGGLAILQLSYFRKVESQLAVIIEQLLFSLYPGVCIVMLTWATSSIVHWELIPYIFLVYGFVYLQMYMVPHSSSFRLEKKETDDDLNVLPQVVTLLMVLMYCTVPAGLHLLLHASHQYISSILSFSVLLHLLFIMSLSVFLSTMMSLRKLAEYMGIEHSRVIQARWVSGAICCVLCYPILRHYEMSSHFLPWLPAGVLLYSVYGAILSDKKFKLVSLVCLPVPSILFAYWLSWLPWKIVYDLMFGVSIATVYVLLLVNCMLCFLCVYSSSYWAQSVTEILLTLESLVLSWCEVLLYNADLYSKAFLIITSAICLYTLHRLHTSFKISLTAMTVCSAVYVTKAIAVIMYSVIGSHEELTGYRCLTLYLMSAVFIRVISLDTRAEISFKEVIQHMVGMCVAIVINTNPVLYSLCAYILWGQPTATDLMGLCIMSCGACILVVGELYLQEDTVTPVRQIGIVSVSFGVLVLLLQPSLEFTWLSLVEWGEVGSVVLTAFIFLTTRVTTLTQLSVCAVLVGLCPGIRLATMLYSYEEDIPTWLSVCRVAIYIPAVSSLVTLLFIFIKFEVVGKTLDRCIMYLCLTLGFLSFLLFMVDLNNRDGSVPVMSLPAWKLLLVTTGVVSIALKIISTTKDLLIPLVEDKKEKELPRLPFIGNISSIVTFFLACMQSPFHLFLNDVWCCASSLILICLQKDNRLFRNLRQENQIVPTMFTCLFYLVMSSYIHTDLWTASSLAFLRSFVEVITITLSLPVYYVLWGILWSDSILWSEKVVVFLTPMNAIYLLYGSTYTSQALGILGLISGGWMMMSKLPLIPFHKSDDR